MARTYDVTLLEPIDPTNLACALAWARFLLRDVPNSAAAWKPGSLDDDELRANLALDAWPAATGLALAYRPHATAARLLVSDPDRLLKFQGGGYGEDYRDPAKVAQAILWAGSRFDRDAGRTVSPRVLPSSLVITPTS